MPRTVFTIGHSTHPTEYFFKLLKMHQVTAVCDVRSKPYSRANPQFNREPLKDALRVTGIAYVFLGKELGARSDDPCCYENGRVKYDRLAQTHLFLAGVERVREGAKKFSVALMCAEREPLMCHRTILVARRLSSPHITIEHIHADGHLESHDDALDRLARMFRLPDFDIFKSREDIIHEAYRSQEERIAYRLHEIEHEEQAAPMDVGE